LEWYYDMKGPSSSSSESALKVLKIPENITESIKELWSDPLINKDTMARAQDYHMNDSAVYFFENVDRVSKAEDPSPQDILRSRYKTTAVYETHFEVQSTKFRIIDVGGQRGERKKWVSFFDDVTAVIFIAAISEYDQVLTEDDNTNRLHETLDVFKKICETKVFERTAIILFLNKDDIFREKIQRVPLTKCFAKYSGGSNYEAARTYILAKFEKRKGNKERDIYPHYTCATDTESFKTVMSAVQDIILTQALHDVHL